MVDFHQDFVSIDCQVSEEIVFILEPLVDELLYYVFTDHSVCNYCGLLEGQGIETLEVLEELETLEALERLEALEVLDALEELERLEALEAF